MVNCAVITCKRRSVTSNLKDHGVSYHTFPKNSPIREQWIKFCGQSKSWQPTKTSVICSEHFTLESFENTSDRRKLVDNAVPTVKFFFCKGGFRNKAFITITSSPLNVSNHTPAKMKDGDVSDLDTMLESSPMLQLCRICLATGQKLYDMQMSNLSQYYNQLTGFNLMNEEEYPQMLCWECVYRLKNYMKFRKKAVCSHELMTEVLQTFERLTTQNLSTIDRHKHDLISKLEIQNIDIHMIESQETELPIVHKPVIDPLSDFVYEEDDAISLTDSDEEEFLNEYKDLLKLENDNLGTKNKETNLSTEKGELKTEIKVEVVKCEKVDVTLTGDHNFDSERNFDSDYNFGSNRHFDNDFDDVNDFAVKNEDVLNFDNSSNGSMDAALSELKSEKASSVGKIKKAVKAAAKNLKGPKKVQKKQVKKERKIKLKRVPKMSRKERSEIYFDKNLIEIVNIKVEDAIALVLKRKDSEHFKDSDFKCFECFKGFCDKGVYDTHLEYHSLKRGEFQCHVCKVRFPKKLSVRKHLNNHLLNYSCKLCGFTTKSRIGAKRHSEYHKKGTLYKCPHCDQKFEKHTSYLGHIRKKHPSDIVCALCGCSFVSIKGLDHHKKLKHRFDDREVKDDGPLCVECNVRFISEDALIMHNHKRHNDNDKSDKSDNELPEKSNIVSDKQEKSKMEKEKKREKRLPPAKAKRKIKRPLKCEQCGLEISTIRAYYWHFRKEHPDKTRTQYFLGNNKYMCEICGRFFQKADILEDHIFTHTGVKIYKCDRCGKEFNTNLSLTIHMKIHDTKRKRYACPVCGKTFLRSNNLKRHEYLHTGLRPFACDLCGKCFPTNSERKTHVEHAHFKKPWPKRNRAKDNVEGRRRLMVSNASTEVMQPQWGTGSESNGDDDESQVPKMYMYM